MAGQAPPGWPEGTGPAELTLPALLEWRAAELGDRPLLRIGQVTRSYRQVCDAAARMAAALADRGVVRGDRVAALCGNRIELMDLILGCGWLGATVVPLNTALRGTSLRQALDAARAPFVLAEPGLAARLDEAAPTGLKARWLAGAVPGGGGVPGGAVQGGGVQGGGVQGGGVPGGAVLGGGVPGGAVEGGGVQGGGVPGGAVQGGGVPGGRSPAWQPAPCPDGYAPRPAAAVEPADTLAILFTSGTTGTPLGVCSPHEQFAWWGINVSRTLRIQPGDVLYTCLPLFHTNALNAFAQAIVAGATYVLGTRFSASAFFDQLREADATVTYLLGAMAGMLMSRPRAAADRAHRCRVALAPATPAHQQAAFRERFGIVLVDGFGSTETNLVIGAPPEEQRPGYLGRVLSGFEAAAVGDDDRPVPDGTPGELVLRSHHRHAFATGYWQLPERTAEAWRDQWFHTGDRVIRDPSGWFTFVERIRDVIRRRGENISSRQVEDALCTHEDVAAAAAFAVPAEFAEDEVMVAVVRKPGGSAGAADLLRHCERQLPCFAVPRYVDLMDELPLTETGKIAKSELRRRGITPATWDRVAAGYRSPRDR